MRVAIRIKHICPPQKKRFSAECSWPLVPASAYDITGIFLVYFGLAFTSVSSYEMPKESVIIVTVVNSEFPNYF